MAEPLKYVKRDNRVLAMQLIGGPEDLESVAQWIRDNVEEGKHSIVVYDDASGILNLIMIEKGQARNHFIEPGQYVVLQPDGTFSSMAESYFFSVYELAE